MPTLSEYGLEVVVRLTPTGEFDTQVVATPKPAIRYYVCLSHYDLAVLGCVCGEGVDANRKANPDDILIEVTEEGYATLGRVMEEYGEKVGRR